MHTSIKVKPATIFSSKLFTGLVMTCFLAACAPEPDSAEQASLEPYQSSGDTSLVQNQVPSGFSFQQFQTIELVFDLAELRQQLTGKHLHVKVTDSNANVYFMALVPASYSNLRTSVSVPLSVAELSVEYYTEQSHESGVLMEVLL